MCGRTRCTLTDADIIEVAAGAKEASPPPGPRPCLAWPDRSRYTPLHNCGPTRVTPVVTAVSRGDGGAPPTITVECMAWGVPRVGGGGRAGAPPSSSSSPPPSSSSALLVNGRSETAFATPTWARALSAGPSGRAVVVCNGYYEWKRPASPAPGQPHYVSRADGAPLALAALVPPGGGRESTAGLRRYAVLTTSPPKSLAWLHDRAPLLLPTPAAVAAWLDPALPPTPATLAALAGPSAVEAWPALTAHPVKLEVGNVRYQAPDCSADVRARKGSIGALFASAAAAAAAAKGSSPGAKTKQGVKKEETGAQQEGGGGGGGGGGVAVGTPAKTINQVERQGGGEEQQEQARKKQKRTLDGFLQKGARV